MAGTAAAVRLGVGSALLFASCARKDAAPGNEGGTGKRIGVTLLTLHHGFYQELRRGHEAEAAACGYELLIVSGGFDATRQANQIDEFVVQKVDALVVCPCDSRSVGAGIAFANAAGIPVFTADIACLAEGAKAVTHVASDNVAGGRLAARE